MFQFLNGRGTGFFKSYDKPDSLKAMISYPFSGNIGTVCIQKELSSILSVDVLSEDNHDSILQYHHLSFLCMRRSCRFKVNLVD